jgi:hypothetical protein
MKRWLLVVGALMVVVLSLPARALASGECSTSCSSGSSCTKACTINGEPSVCGEWGVCNQNQVFSSVWADCHCLATERPYVWRVLNHYRNYNWFGDYLWCTAQADAYAGEYEDGQDCVNTNGCAGTGDPGLHC